MIVWDAVGKICLKLQFIADEIVDELYSLSDCGCTLEDEAVKADLEMLEKYGFGSRADKVRELCWK